MSDQFVGYFRVSTDRQGRSGLGLEAQRDAVLRHLAGVGGRLQGEFVEIESGKRNDRPQLAAAIAATKKAKATLIIAKLDRLARNVHFVSGLMESGVDFIAADNPHANKLMVHLLAAFAEHEREQISQRTKDALAAAKARGVRLGVNGTDRLAPAHHAEAVERARRLAPLLEGLKCAGLSVRQMAAELTARGIPTPTGARWHAQTVSRVLNRIGSLSLAVTAGNPCREAIHQVADKDRDSVEGRAHL
jgi:DNA invertase Pin-like site-specific DNA recombinase